MLQDDMTSEQAEALFIAGGMIDAGIPIFSAKPCTPACPSFGWPNHGAGGYHLPNKWQLTVPSRVWLERWEPGDALAVVGGGLIDVVDVDPRNGGDVSAQEMKAAGQWPREFGMQTTPSGGYHVIISATGEPECNGFMPGLDLQSGAPDGSSRAFAFIAPTVKKSKGENAGQLGTYRWVKPPDLDLLAEFSGGGDDSVEGVRTRVAAYRSRSTTRTAPPITPVEARLFGGGDDRNRSPFTTQQALAFCEPFLADLAAARVGHIEEKCNIAAAAISHFVPLFFSAEEGMAALRTRLTSTAYDETHPASTWTVEKFRAVLDGRRPPVDNWKAEQAPPPPSPAETLAEGPSGVTGDEVDALIAEMLTPEQIATRPPPRPLIRGLLNLDSESWIIGEPGSKKSFVAADMAGHVVRGRQWQGLKVTAADVVMIVAEGAGGMSSRVKAWEQEYGPMRSEQHSLRILPRPVQAKSAGAWAVLVEACRRLKPGLIVVDTQARVTVGLEENSATEMGVYVEAVRALREATGACVLTVHHTGRKGGDARGSSAIDGAQHTELKVESRGLSGQLKVEKQKDMEALPPRPLKFKVLTVGVDEDGVDVTSLVLEADAWKLAQEADPATEEPWESGHAVAIVQLFKVLRDQGRAGGLTKSEARLAVIERFYGNDPKKLAKSTWYTAWDRGQEKVAASGDPVMVNVKGEKWIVDEVALAELPPRDQD